MDFKKISTFFWLCVFAKASSFFVLSDLHFDILYKPDYSEESKCHEVGIRGYREPNPLPSTDLKPLGRYKCDPPLALIESTIGKLKQIDAEPDFIIVTGDFLGHFTSSSLSPDGVFDFEYNKALIVESFTLLVLSLIHI